MKVFDIDLIIKIQGALRCPFFDYLFYAITFLGSEYFFLIITLVLYLCVNKKFAYKFFNVFMFGQLFIGATKTLIKRPRPFERGADAVFSKSKGYSFPSGHSHNAANMSTQFAINAKESTKKIYYIVIGIGAALTVLVMFSRLYLGQHYLFDVIVGAIYGVVAAIIFSKLFKLFKDKEQNLVFAVFPICIIAFIILVILGKNPEGVIRVLGAYSAMSFGYYLEKKYINFNVKSGNYFKQIIKIIIGTILVLTIKGLFSFIEIKLELNNRIFMILNFICYYILGFLVSFSLPMFFKRINL